MLIVSAATICQFSASLYYFSKIDKLFVIDHTGMIINISRIIYAITAVVEILLASVVVVLVHMMRNGQKRSETVLNRLILYTISSSAGNAAIAIGAVISAAVSPYVHTHLLFASLAPNCNYISSLIVSHS